MNGKIYDYVSNYPYIYIYIYSICIIYIRINVYINNFGLKMSM